MSDTISSERSMANYSTLVNTWPDATQAWEAIVHSILKYGQGTSPRGMKTWEVPHASISFNMQKPVFAIKRRRLNYRFMAAEAYWILHGRSDLGFLLPYNEKMAQFSDDKSTLAGAYGPPIAKQFLYVVSTLLKDRASRQAVLTIWRPNPEPSRDIPCTVAISFSIRGSALNCHVYMRSSDAFLGVPYDFFSFSALAIKIAAAYNESCFRSNSPELIYPGWLYWTAASSHLYERDVETVKSVLGTSIYSLEPVPELYWMHGQTGYTRFCKDLRVIMDSEVESRPNWVPNTKL